jgi:5-methylthioribose kinase
MQLTVDSVAAHIARRPQLADKIDATRLHDVVEVGDGNLNLVFIVRDQGGRSLVLKQALPHVRVDPTWPMTLERARFESAALAAHGKLDPEHVPALLDFDSQQYVIAMEDLSDHTVWRTALNAGQQHEGAAADIGQSVARTAFGTSALGLGTFELKAAIAESFNPALCQITEDLVFTEPYIEHEHNRVLAANQIDVEEFRSDPEVIREAGLAKWLFMTGAEALVHGDLHTGSVMVRGESDGKARSTKAFDSEFAFYGPIGFDLGALWGNLVLAAARAVALGETDRAAWCLEQASQMWNAFESEIRLLWPRRVDPRVWDDNVLDTLLDTWRSDSAVFAGAKIARRIIGFAKVSDIESLPEQLRVGAARGGLRAARLLMVERHSSSSNVAELNAALLPILNSATTR